MKSLLIGFICLFSCVLSAQKNKMDSFQRSLTSNGYLSGNVFVNRIAVIAVDFYDMKVTVMGKEHKFVIMAKDVFGDDTLTTIQYADTLELAAITENKKKGGFYSYYTFQSKMVFRTED